MFCSTTAVARAVSRRRASLAVSRSISDSGSRGCCSGSLHDAGRRGQAGAKASRWWRVSTMLRKSTSARSCACPTNAAQRYCAALPLHGTSFAQVDARRAQPLRWRLCWAARASGDCNLRGPLSRTPQHHATRLSSPQQQHDRPPGNTDDDTGWFAGPGSCGCRLERTPCAVRF